MIFFVFPTLLLLIVAAAIGYLSYHLADSKADPNNISIGIGTGISILLTLGCVVGVSMEDSVGTIASHPPLGGMEVVNH